MDSWIQDRPGPGCHFKQSDRGEKPCLMASLPQKSWMLVISEGLRKSLKGEQSRSVVLSGAVTICRRT